MSTTTRITTAERLGRWLGRSWRGVVRGERRVAAWMVGKGAPVAAATALVWVVKLTVLGVLLYVAFWAALLLLFAIAAVQVLEQQYQKDELFELQYPTIEELREIPGYDPNLHGDSSHEMYRHE